MSVEIELKQRSGSKCELCKSSENLSVYEVPPVDKASKDECILVCNTCLEKIQTPSETGNEHWRCLSDSMWNENPAVQVMVWRLLNRIKSESWANDLLEMMYMEDKTLKWAKKGVESVSSGAVVHFDSNGAVLNNGDTVTLIKELNVKGSSLIAKRGTAVRRITLVADNPEQIEGKVEGQQIVILTKYVKKSN